MSHTFDLESARMDLFDAGYDPDYIECLNDDEFRKWMKSRTNIDPEKYFPAKSRSSQKKFSLWDD